MKTLNRNSLAPRRAAGRFVQWSSSSLAAKEMRATDAIPLGVLMLLCVACDDSAVDSLRGGQFVEGIPLAHVEELEAISTEELIRLLEDDLQQESDPTVAFLLGWKAESGGYQALVRYIRRPPTPSAAPQKLIEVLNCLLGLGFTAAKTGGNNALAYLLTHACSARGWADVQWDVEGLTRPERDVVLTRGAFNGLAVSGSDKALECLKRAAAASCNGDRLCAAIAENASDNVRVFNDIERAGGVKNYFQSYD